VWHPFKRRLHRLSPRVPPGVRIYAIGDVHGRIDLLDQVFLKIDADLARRPVPRARQIILGDYVDRGPHSKGVINRLIERGQTNELICLKGNHESCVLEFLRNPSSLLQWRALGGFETLRSYGVTGLPPAEATAPYSECEKLAEEFARMLPASHWEFFSRLKLSFVCGDFFFVHAGVRPGVPLALQAEEDLLWIRDDFLLYEQDYGKVIVHGHTPVPELEILLNRINIDTGAYATGRLTCIVLEEDVLIAL
jgi:serine/threonine protein phosphatase 1